MEHKQLQFNQQQLWLVKLVKQTFEAPQICLVILALCKFVCMYVSTSIIVIPVSNFLGVLNNCFGFQDLKLLNHYPKFPVLKVVGKLIHSQIDTNLRAIMLALYYT